MKSGSYASVSGVVFALVALMHALRAVLNVPVQVGSQALPIGISWAGAGVAAMLCIWAFRTVKQSRI